MSCFCYKATSTSTTPTSPRSSTEERTTAAETPTQQAAHNLASQLNSNLRIPTTTLTDLPDLILDKIKSSIRKEESKLTHPDSHSLALTCRRLYPIFGLASVEKATMITNILKPDSRPFLPQYRRLFTPEETTLSLKTALKAASLENSKLKELNFKLKDFIHKEIETIIEEIIKSETQLSIKLTIDGYKDSSLPESLGNLANLKMLSMTYCQNLTQLPTSLGNLANLEELSLLECTKLTHIPNSLSNLTNLTVLGLCNLPQLDNLPPNLHQLSKLKELYLNRLNITTLPENIGQLSALELLDLGSCNQLKTLPESIGDLPELTTLDLAGCPVRNRLPDNLSQRPGLTIIKEYHH